MTLILNMFVFDLMPFQQKFSYIMTVSYQYHVSGVITIAYIEDNIRVPWKAVAG